MMMTMTMDDQWKFLIYQFPASYIATGIWYQIVLPLMPNWVQAYRKYDVVRNVDYLPSRCAYSYVTWILFFTFLPIYMYLKPNDSFPFLFSLMSWIGILCMEMALQISGKRKMKFSKTDYWTGGSNVISIIVQTLREGAVCFGLPALECYGLLEDRKEQPIIFYSALVAFIVDWSFFFHLLYTNIQKKQKRDYGTTTAIGRRSILDTIMYRAVELYVIYHIYQLYPEMFWNNKEFIIMVTLHRSIGLGLFFAVGTYSGLTWIDRGPKVECTDNWFWFTVGLIFRVVESTLSGYPKTIALTYLLMKLVEK